MKRFLRTISLFLCVLMLMQSGMLAASAKKVGYPKTFDDGEMVLALNTNYGNLTERLFGNMTEGEERTARSDDRQVSGCADVVECDWELLTPAEALKKQASYSGTQLQAVPTEYKLGDKKTVFDGRYVELECVYAGKNCTIWLDMQDENETVKGCVSLGEYFDDKMDEVCEIFGDQRIDTDHDGKIALLVYDILDEGVGGYFKYADIADKYGRVGNVWFRNIGANSMHCDCVHIEAGMSDFGKKLIAVHEYQHYLTASSGYVGKNNLTAVTHTDSYLTEGFSCCAEYMLLNKYDRYTYSFDEAVMEPDAHSIIHWDFDAYSLSYVFTQYLRTRYATLTGDLEGDFPGKAFFKKVLSSRTVLNQNDTLGLYASILYPEIKDKDVSRRQLLRDFWIAVYKREKTGIHGFLGEKWAEEIDVAEMIRTNFASGQSLSPSMAAFYRVPENGELTISRAGADVELITLPKSDNALIWDYNDGTGRTDSLETFGEVYTDLYIRRFGYNMVGWAFSKDAKRADVPHNYTPEGKVTIYAIWEKAQTITTLTAPYIVSGYKENFLFTPSEDGVYRFDLDKNGNYAMIYTQDSDDPVTDDDYIGLEDEETSLLYVLKGGVTYNILMLRDNENRSSYFTISKEDEPVFLTLDLNLPDQESVYTTARFPETWIADIDYYLGYDELEALPGTFRGWAQTKDATKPSIRPYEEITLEEDMTLYAVWGSKMEIVAGKEMSVAHDYSGQAVFATFTPKKSGTYSATGTASFLTISIKNPQNDSYCYLYDRYDDEEIGNMEYTEFVTLQAGTTYTVRISSYMPESVSDFNIEFDYLEDADFARLYLYPFGNETAIAMYKPDGSAVEIPNIEPISTKYTKFIGWASLNDEVYQPGDSIVLMQDEELYPRWDEESSVKNPMQWISLQIQNIGKWISWMWMVLVD